MIHVLAGVAKNIRNVMEETLEEVKLDSQELLSKVKILEKNIHNVIKGKPEAVKSSLIALFARGNILIEDVPGVGKTTLANAIAKSTDLEFKRIQFTSDLLPSDILGVSILDNKSGDFNFKKGPIFANIVLADEINRATPKTQSALLEAMNESKATIDGNVYDLPKPFMIIATQNPFEFKGTFPLPENQLDRFAIRLSIGYPDHESEKQILANSNYADIGNEIKPCLSQEEVLKIQKMVEDIHIEESVLEYILNIIEETRNPKLFELGASPRGSIALKRISQARALLDGRTFCIPDDVKKMVPTVLAHRIVSKYDHLGNSGIEQELLYEILVKVKVPL